jgi:hypothetical protein
MREIIEKIAEDILNIETLEIRGRDSLGFHDLSVWQIKEALEKAYNAGRYQNNV